MRATETAVLGGIVVGIGLVVLGVGSYVVTEFASVTALLPAIAGVVFAALGAVGRRQPDREGQVLWALAVLAAIGFAGTLRMLPAAIALVTGGAVDSVVAAAANGIMAVGCLLIVLPAAYAILERRRRGGASAAKGGFRPQPPHFCRPAPSGRQ